jgi:hypothetical protein
MLIASAGKALRSDEMKSESAIGAMVISVVVIEVFIPVIVTLVISTPCNVEFRERARFELSELQGLYCKYTPGTVPASDLWITAMCFLLSMNITFAWRRPPSLNTTTFCCRLLVFMLGIFFVSVRNVGLALPAILLGLPFVFFVFCRLGGPSSMIKRSISLLLSVVVSPFFIGCLLLFKYVDLNDENILNVLLLDIEQVLGCLSRELIVFNARQF